MSHLPLADPELFLAIDDLDLATRALVDSALAGNHRGTSLGPGAEFAQHRAYRLGDDLRQINWRLYGRTRRLQVKEVFAEAKMPVQILVDASASMRTGTPVTKYFFAARLPRSFPTSSRRSSDRCRRDPETSARRSKRSQSRAGSAGSS